MEVRGQRNYWRLSALIVRRGSKPRPVHRKPGYGKEKTEAANRVSKQRKSEGLRKESLKNTNSRITTRLLGGTGAVFIT